MSFKPEVQVYNDRNWYPNGVAFATVEECEHYARDLALRWTQVDKYRVMPSDAPVTHRWTEAGVCEVYVKPEAAE